MKNRNMNRFIELNRMLAVLALFVVCAIAGSPVFAIAPVLDLDADDSRVVGIGYVATMEGAPTSVTDDVLITDDDGNKLSRAIITIINPKPGDRLVQGDLEGQLIYDPTSTDTELIITGSGPLEKYGTALESITFFNDCTACDSTPRFISIFVEGIGGESSNTALTTIDGVYPPDSGPPIALRGFIYTTVRDALSQVHLSGAIVSVSETYGSLEVYELEDQYVLDIDPPGIYTVNASLPGYESTSVNDVVAEDYNDPSSPIPIYLDASGADADVVPDGQLNAGDFLVATRITLGLRAATTIELAHGDMNSDGEITLSDLVLILQAIQTAP
jgi:hypothetical protein